MTADRQTSCKIAFGNILTGISDCMHLPQYPPVHPDSNDRPDQYQQRYSQCPDPLHDRRKSRSLDYVSPDQQTIIVRQCDQRGANRMLLHTFCEMHIYFKLEPFIVLNAELRPCIQIAYQGFEIGIGQQIYRA